MKIVKTIFCISLLFANVICFAGGFQVNTQGQKALGMGGAFTGSARDVSAVFFNPGAIPNLQKKQNLSLGVAFVIPNVSVQTAAVRNTDMTSPSANPIQLYYSIRFLKKFAFGFGLNNQFGSTSSYPDEWEGRFIIQKLSLRTFMYQPTLAYKINKYVSIGAGFVYTTADFELRKSVPLSSSTSNEASAGLTGSSTANGFNLGAFANPIEQVSLGLSYRSQINLEIKDGVAKFSNIPGSLATIYPDNVFFQAGLKLPAVLSLGFGFHPDSAKKFLVVFDINKTYWSAYDTLNFDFENELTPDSKVTKSWENSHTFRLGISYQVIEKLQIRIGSYFDESPVPDGFVSPELPDKDHVGFTLGFGYQINKNISLDASWLYSNLKRSASLDAEGFSGSYHRIINVFGIGLNIEL